MSLSFDKDRCEGVINDGEWREGCEDCMRRTEPGHPERQSYRAPPEIIVFECEARIAPNVKAQGRAVGESLAARSCAARQTMEMTDEV